MIVLLMLCAFGGLFAQSSVGLAVRLAEMIGSFSENDKIAWQGRLMWRMPIKSQLQKERGFWDVTWAWISGSQKEQEVQALAGYLFNMYIFSAAQGRLPQQLDLSFTGVLDPLENIAGGYQAQEIKSLYADEKEDVKKHLSRLFKNKLGISYNQQDKQNDAREEKFLQILQNSSRAGKRAFYVANKAMLPTQQASQEVKQALQKKLAGCIDGSAICTYEQIDMFDMMDRKSGAARRDYFYRPASQECDACAYSYCKRACLNPQQNYAGWTVDGLYRLHARPQQNKFLMPAQGKAFLSVDGKKYAPWHYHAAALFRLKKDGQYTLLVQDPFLFEEPVPLAVWAESFLAEDVLFYAYPFQRQEKIESQFVQIPADQLEALKQGNPVKVGGIKYEPYPVYSAD